MPQKVIANKGRVTSNFSKIFRVPLTKKFGKTLVYKLQLYWTCSTGRIFSLESGKEGQLPWRVFQLQMRTADLPLKTNVCVCVFGTFHWRWLTFPSFAADAREHVCRECRSKLIPVLGKILSKREIISLIRFGWLELDRCRDSILPEITIIRIKVDDSGFV